LVYLQIVQTGALVPVGCTSEQTSGFALVAFYPNLAHCALACILSTHLHKVCSRLKIIICAPHVQLTLLVPVFVIGVVSTDALRVLEKTVIRSPSADGSTAFGFGICSIVSWTALGTLTSTVSQFTGVAVQSSPKSTFGIAETGTGAALQLSLGKYIARLN
tara:strand:+ start:265 stop:747 length:483 start_codon:yes stop_codon:yes gene_type:complete